MNWKFWTWDLWRWGQLRNALAEEREGAMRELNAVRRQRDEERAHRETISREWREDHEKLFKDIGEKTAQIRALTQQLSAVHVLRRLESAPLSKPELLAALEGVTEATPWWQAVHALLNDCERMEVGAICAPGIGDENAHRNRGRISMVQDFRNALLSHHADSQKQTEGES